MDSTKKIIFLLLSIVIVLAIATTFFSETMSLKGNYDSVLDDAFRDSVKKTVSCPPCQTADSNGVCNSILQPGQACCGSSPGKPYSIATERCCLASNPLLADRVIGINSCCETCDYCIKECTAGSCKDTGRVICPVTGECEDTYLYCSCPLGSGSDSDVFSGPIQNENDLVSQAQSYVDWINAQRCFFGGSWSLSRSGDRVFVTVSYSWGTH